MASQPKSDQRVLIVGGGVSGLSAAYYLAKAGIRSILVESKPQLGGVVQTEAVEGCILEAGPDSFLSIKPAALELIRELSLSGDVIGSNDHLRITYIRKNGSLVPLPDGLMMMVPTRVLPMLTSPLLSWRSKIAMGMEYFRRPDPAVTPDRSVAEFIRDHYGDEAVEYLAEPLLSGVYGGSPERLSVNSVLPRFVELEKRYGSLTRGVLATRKKPGATSGGPLFQTLRGGLGQIVDALKMRLEGSSEWLRGTAETIRQEEAGGFSVRVDGHWVAAGDVVVAVPAWEASLLLSALAPDLAEPLGKIEYSSSMTVALVYDRSSLERTLVGFGFLVPRKERNLMVACTFVGNKFAFRVPEDKFVLRCFLGGAGNDAVLRLSDDEVLSGLKHEIREILGVGASPTAWRISRWPRAMAQYTVGHDRRLQAIREGLAKLPGLHLVGNAYSGIGIPDCIRTGQEAASQIAARLPQ